MLRQTRINHIASNLQRDPFQEKRLLYFAANEDSVNSNEDLPEGATPPDSSSTARSIEGIANDIHSQIVRTPEILGPLLAEHASKSSFILRTLVTKADFEDEQDRQTLVQRMTELEQGTETSHSEAGKRSVEIIHTICSDENPENLLTLAEAYEDRLQTYEDFEYINAPEARHRQEHVILSGEPLRTEEYKTVEASWLLQAAKVDKETGRTPPTTLHELAIDLPLDELRALCDQLHIRLDSIQKGHEEFNKQREAVDLEPIQFDEKQALLHIVERYSSKANTLRYRQGIDAGASADEDAITTKKRLEHMGNSLRQHIDAKMVANAKGLLATMNKRLPGIIDSLSKSPHVIAPIALQNKIMEAVLPVIGLAETDADRAEQVIIQLFPEDLQQEIATKIANAKEGGNVKIPARVDHPQYLQLARSSFEMLEDLSYISDEEEVSSIENKLLGNEKQQHTKNRSIAARIAPDLQKGLEDIAVDPSLQEHVAENLLGSSPAPKQVTSLFKDELPAQLALLEKFSTDTTTAEDENELYQRFSQSDQLAKLYLTTKVLTNTAQFDWRKTAIDSAKENEDTHLSVEKVEQRFTQSKEDIEALSITLLDTNGQQYQLALLEHEVLQTIGITNQLSQTYSEIESAIRRAKTIKNHNDVSAVEIQKQLLVAVVATEQLEKANAMMSEISNGTKIVVIDEDKFEKQTGSKTCRGVYSPDNNTIYIKNGLSSADRSQIVHHELGHALLNILGKKTTIANDTFQQLSTALSSLPSASVENSTLLQILQGMKNRYDVDEEAILQKEKQKLENEGFASADRGFDTQLQKTLQIRVEREVNEALMDELLNRYATWTKRGRTWKIGEQESLSPLNDAQSKEQELFKLLDIVTNNHAEQHTGQFNTAGFESLDAPNFDFDVATVRRDGEGNDEEDEPESQDEDSDVEPLENPGQLAEELNFKNSDPHFQAVEQALTDIQHFLRDHPGIDGEAEAEEYYKAALSAYNTVSQRFTSQGDDRIDDSQAIEVLMAIMEKLEPLDSAIKGAKMEELDISEISGRTGLLTMAKSIRLLSVADVVDMVKAAGEDMKRIYERRKALKQANAGAAILEWIPESIPYLGRLSHEFTKRGSSSEQEEVNHWKDALKETDSYALIGQLSSTSDKDHMRAMIETLVERGQMDWNHIPFWETLEELSAKYGTSLRMPMQACKNNDLLRDKWIQKMITDIWGDKEHFYNWRRQNDSAYKSKMDEFTDIVDQLSNMSGGLSGELERQLKLWDIHHNERSESWDNIPEDVNPHKYEKIILYAIENGKMTMEDKFYYLVQGIAKGLLSIDRIRVLAGERGGVLNIFPLIDYFYGHNNTLPEMQALAKRLEEPDNKYKPGPNTTLWIHLEVSRDENARQRVSKASSGTRLEKIDHEDIPTLVAQLGYEDVARMANVVSGSRQQMSPEAQKNSYVGFGTKFLALARLAQMDQEGVARFTDQDVYELAKSMTASIHMDNILTWNANDGNANRPKLPWDDIEHTKGPSTGGRYVKDVRDGNYTFIHKIMDGINQGEGFNWSGVEAQMDRNTDVEFDKDSFLLDPGSSSEDQETLTKKRKGNFTAIQYFADELRNQLLANKQEVIKSLASFAENMNPGGSNAEYGQRLVPEFDNQQLTKDNTRDFFKTQKKARQHLQNQIRT